jgi:hypothetical protein
MPQSLAREGSAPFYTSLTYGSVTWKQSEIQEAEPMTSVLTQDVRQQLHRRAQGRCECTMSLCLHHRGGERCPHALGEGWQAHRITAGGAYTLSNLRAMCKTCHKNTPSYGSG